MLWQVGAPLTPDSHTPYVYLLDPAAEIDSQYTHWRGNWTSVGPTSHMLPGSHPSDTPNSGSESDLPELARQAQPRQARSRPSQTGTQPDSRARPAQGHHQHPTNGSATTSVDHLHVTLEPTTQDVQTQQQPQTQSYRSDLGEPQGAPPPPHHPSATQANPVACTTATTTTTTAATAQLQLVEAHPNTHTGAHPDTHTDIHTETHTDTQPQQAPGEQPKRKRRRKKPKGKHDDNDNNDNDIRHPGNARNRVAQQVVSTALDLFRQWQLQNQQLSGEQLGEQPLPQTVSSGVPSAPAGTVCTPEGPTCVHEPGSQQSASWHALTWMSALTRKQQHVVNTTRMSDDSALGFPGHVGHASATSTAPTAAPAPATTAPVAPTTAPTAAPATTTTTTTTTATTAPAASVTAQVSEVTNHLTDWVTLSSLKHVLHPKIQLLTTDGLHTSPTKAPDLCAFKSQSQNQEAPPATSSHDPRQDLYGPLVSNDQSVEAVALAHDTLVLLPSHSSFIMTDLTLKHALAPLAGKRFPFIVMDPPWENASVKRSRRYHTLPSRALLPLPVKQLLDQDRGVLILWMTNRERLHRFVMQELLPAWGLRHVATWYWLKLADGGQGAVSSLASMHRHPFEHVLVAAPANAGVFAYPGHLPDLGPMHSSRFSAHARHAGEVVADKRGQGVVLPAHLVLMSVPAAEHSRKPHLGSLLRCLNPALGPTFDAQVPGAARVGLELFSRELHTGWVSAGNATLAFQQLSLHHQLRF